MDATTQAVGSGGDSPVLAATREARAAWSALTPDDLRVGDGDATPEPSSGSEPEPVTPQPEPEPVAAAPAEGEGHQDTQQTDPSQDGPDKFWNQYPTEEARKKALFENKRYAAEMSRRARELEAELEKLRSGQQTPQAQPTQTPPVAPAAAPTQPAYVPGTPVPPELLVSTIQQLSDKDPWVRQATQSIGAIKTQHDKLTAERTELEKGVAETDVLIQKTSWEIEHYQALLTKTTDEDTKYNIQAAIDQANRKRDGLEISKGKREVRLHVIGLEQQRLEATHGNYAQQLVKYTTDFLGRESEKAQEQETVDRLAKESGTQWKMSLQEFAKKHNITDPEELQDINKEFLYRAKAALEPEGVGIPEFQAWMLGPEGDDVAATVKRYQERAVKRYAEAKRADASQPAPAGVATGKPRPAEDEVTSPGQNLDAITREAKANLLRTLGR